MFKMRTRTEIVEQRARTVQNSTQGSYFETRQSAALEAILEVLLDIRDQLTVIKQVMPESDQFENK